MLFNSHKNLSVFWDFADKKKILHMIPSFYVFLKQLNWNLFMVTGKKCFWWRSSKNMKKFLIQICSDFSFFIAAFLMLKSSQHLWILFSLYRRDDFRYFSQVSMSVSGEFWWIMFLICQSLFELGSVHILCFLKVKEKFECLIS